MRPRPWTRLVAAATALTAVTGCEPLAAAGNDAPRIVSVGPVRGADDATVTVDFTVHDRETDPVQIEVTVCQPAAGERCADAADTCAPANGLGPTGNPVVVHGDPDAAALTVRSLTWRPACQRAPLDATTELTLCLRPRDGSPLESAAFTLTSLGIAPGDTTPSTPCP